MKTKLSKIEKIGIIVIIIIACACVALLPNAIDYYFGIGEYKR